MKKLIFMLVFAIVAIAANAQTRALTFATADTLNGNETVYFTGPTFTGDQPIAIQAACDNVGGTSDGALTLEGSVDGTDWVTLRDATGIVHGFAGATATDSLTIVDGANITWVIEKNVFSKYRIKGVGTADDSTLVTTKYIRK